MAINYNTQSIVTDSISLCVVAANHASYPGSGTSWNDIVGHLGGTISGATFTFYFYQ